LKTKLFIVLIALTSVFAAEEKWDPVKDPTINGRALDVVRMAVKPEWGYPATQQDSYIVVLPKVDRKNAPLYVVLHSAGHDVVSCVKCTKQVGNHDIYHSPDDFYALYLDCRENKGDWWWGGMHVKDANLTKKNSGGDPMPVEKRVMANVRAVIEKYGIDPNRVYLCGNSMGGSGALGIGTRNGDVFAAIKANVPAGIEHVSQRMYFPPATVPETVKLPEPPVVIDYSGQNDGWSAGHERFVKAMNDRKYALYFYWGPFGHANNTSQILKVNDLINSFDWLTIKKNELYAVFTNATCNSKLPWPDDLKNIEAGQINAFFRWKTVSDTAEKVDVSLLLMNATELKTKFEIPKEASADVTLRRLQKFKIKAGEAFKWSYGSAKGEGKADAEGLVTVSGLKMTAEPVTLSVSK